MGKPIKNAYVAMYSKYFKAWIVNHRWLCGNDLKFEWVCHCKHESAARLVARALNAQEKEAKNEAAHIPDDIVKPVPVADKPDDQPSFSFM